MDVFLNAAVALAVATEAGFWIPRNPVSYWLHMVSHRVSINLLPRWTHASYIFDSALLLHVAIAYLAFAAATARASKVSPWRVVKMLFVVYLFAHTVVLSNERSARLITECEEAFPGAAGWGDAPFDYRYYLLNHLGRSENLHPQHTSLLFKTITEAAPAPCVGALCNLNFLPGDGSERLKDEQPDVGRHLYLDIFDSVERTAGTAPPLILHVHGGGWRAGNRKFLKWNYRGGIPGYLSTKYVIASVSYRLTDDGWSGDDALEDVLDSLDYMVKWCSDTKRCDPTKVGIMGTSAGGHLAQLVGLARPNLIAGILNLYGPAELRRDVLESAGYNTSLPLIERIYALGFRFFTSPLCPERLADREACFDRMSPVAAVEKLARTHTAIPLMVLAQGTSDGLVSHITHTVPLFEAVRAARPNHAGIVLLDCPNHDHDFDVRNSSPCAQMTLYAASRMFAKAFGE